MAGPADLAAYKDALIILGASAVMAPLLRHARINPVIGFIAAGCALGPLGLGQFTGAVPWLAYMTIPDAKALAAVGELGVVFLFFLIGLELSFERLTRLKKLVFGLGAAQVVACAAAIAAIASALDQPMTASIIIGAALALSCTSITIEHLAQEKRLASGAGRTAFSILLFQDLAVIPMLIAVPAMTGSGEGSIAAPLALAMTQAAAAILAVIVIGRLLLRPFFRFLALSGKTEAFMAGAVLVIIGAGVAASAMGASMALGAFMAGLLLAETEYRRAIEATIEPFKSLLLGLFFFSVGMSIDPSLVIGQPATVAALIVGLIALKTIITVPLALAFGLNVIVSLRAALLLGPAGEFTFILIGAATVAGLVGGTIAGLIVVASAISMALIPALDRLGGLATARLQPAPPIDPAVREKPPAPTARTVIVVGYGRVGMLVGEMLQRHDVPFIAVDSDAREVGALRRQGHPVYFGDARQPGFLETCGLGEAAAVVLTLHTADAIDDIAARVKALRPDMTVIARARDANHAKRLYALGVTDAVPETIEASLQLSEAVLFDIGLPAGLVIASIHEKRDEFRKDLRARDGAEQGAARRALSAARKT